MTAVDSVSAYPLPTDPTPEVLRELLDCQRRAFASEALPDVETSWIESIVSFLPRWNRQRRSRPRSTLTSEAGTALANLRSDVAGALGPVRTVPENLAD
ncbi:hypothetical protein IU483_27600 [Streptomyces gardneri]|nr:hypothetical protein [Streptomyces gardneri]